MKLLLSSVFLVSLCSAFHPLSSRPHQQSTRLYGFLDDMFQKPIENKPQQPVASKSTTKKKSSKRADSWLDGMFNDPVHGAGSAADDGVLQEMWQEQQDLLQSRRQHAGQNSDKGKLKKKYFHKSHDQLEAQRLREDVAWERSHGMDHKVNGGKLKNKQEDEAMYLDEDYEKNPFFKNLQQMKLKMPWESKDDQLSA